MGNVRLYGSTSGYTELAPPAVAPDGVLSLPSGVGTLLTAEGGKILQIVRATDTTNRSTTSTSMVDANISVTITPTKTDSIILIVWNVHAFFNGTNNYMEMQITNSSNVALSGAEQCTFGDATSNQPLTQIHLIGYVTPGTLSAVTYKGRFKRRSTGTATLLNGDNTGQLFAIEVSA